MKYIEFKSEGYTFRYDFESTPSTKETFNPNIVIPVANRSSAAESLNICISCNSFRTCKDSANFSLGVAIFVFVYVPNFVFADVAIFVFTAVLLFVFTANLTKLCLLQHNLLPQNIHQTLLDLFLNGAVSGCR